MCTLLSRKHYTMKKKTKDTDDTLRKNSDDEEKKKNAMEKTDVQPKEQTTPQSTDSVQPVDTADEATTGQKTRKRFFRTSRLKQHFKSKKEKLSESLSSLSAFVKKYCQKAKTSIVDAYNSHGKDFIKQFTRAMRLLSHMLIKLLKVVFYPIILITKAVSYVTKKTVKFFFMAWKRVLAVVFLMLAVVLCVNDHRLAEWSGVTLSRADNKKDPMHRKLLLSKQILIEHLYTPILTFLSVGLPQLTYEVLRIWHFILADNATFLLDMLATSVRFAKRLLPQSWQSLLAWERLEQNGFAKQLQEGREKDIRKGDTLLKFYLNASNTIVDTSTRSTRAFLNAGWSASSRGELDILWKNTVTDTSTNASVAYGKYIKGEIKDNDANVQNITLSQAHHQLTRTPKLVLFKTKKKPLFSFSKAKQILMHSSKQNKKTMNYNLIDVFPESAKNAMIDVYFSGTKAISKYIFQQDDPDKVTVVNLAQVYFGVVALGSGSVGAVEGLQRALFQNMRTGAVINLGVKMKAIEEVVPVCFYLDE